MTARSQPIRFGLFATCVLRLPQLAVDVRQERMGILRLRLQPDSLLQEWQCRRRIVLHTKKPSQKKIGPKVVRINLQSFAVSLLRI